MTPSELKANYEHHNPEGKFFTRVNMKFARDTMRNYRVTDNGDTWKLNRIKPVKCGLTKARYFCKKDFSLVKVND